jgi:queuosine precursor transporter
VDRKQVLYLWLAGLFVAALLVADLVGGKFFRIGAVDLSIGMLAFPLTFLLTDLLNEFYGPQGARRVTYLGLGAALFAFLLINLALVLPASPKGMPDEVFRSAFGWSRRLYFASLTAYLLGQLADITIFSALRRLTKHRLLWLRATGSTLVSQALDTVVVNFVLLWGAESVGAILRIVYHSYLLKILIAVVLTPLIYALHAFLLRGMRIPETSSPPG